MTADIPSIHVAHPIPYDLATEVLAKSRNNWPRWHRRVIQCLQMVNLEGYLHGSIPCPDRRVDPFGAINWQANDKAVTAFIGLKSSEEEQAFIQGMATAEEVWDSLRARHETAKPQILLVQEALRIRYSDSEEFENTSTKLSGITSRIFSMGALDEDTFLSALTLNALSGELIHVREHVTNLIFSGNLSTPLKPADIHHLLPVQRNGGSEPPSPSSSRSYKPQRVCSVCRLTGHSADRCWREGGGMEGRRSEILAEKARKRGASNGNASFQDANMRTDSNGRTFPNPVDQLFIPEQPSQAKKGPTPTFDEMLIVSLIHAEMSKVRTEFSPAVGVFLYPSLPNTDLTSEGKQAKLTERKRLSELLLQCLLRLDGFNVERGWQEARRERKEAVNEVQALLDRLGS